MLGVGHDKPGPIAVVWCNIDLIKEAVAININFMLSVLYVI